MLKPLLLALALSAACSTVRTPVPLGDLPADLAAGDWAGRYFAGEGRIALEVAYGQADELVLQFFELGSDEVWDADGRGPVLMRELDPIGVDESEGGFFLVHFPNEQGTRAAPFDLFLVRGFEGALITWPPNVEHFAGLVDAGTLPGEVERDGDTTRVTLGELDRRAVAEHFEADLGASFDLTSPITLVRIADDLLHEKHLRGLLRASQKANEELDD